MKIENLSEDDRWHEYGNALSKLHSYLQIYAANVDQASYRGPSPALEYFANRKECINQVIFQYRKALELAKKHDIPNARQKVRESFETFLSQVDPKIRNSAIFESGIKEILQELGEHADESANAGES